MTSITSLVGDHKNARRRTDRSSQLIKESLQKYGAARSIVIDEDNRILAGNGTSQGAKAAGIKNVRIIETDGDEIIAVKRTGLSEEINFENKLEENKNKIYELKKMIDNILKNPKKLIEANQKLNRFSKKLDGFLNYKTPTVFLTDLLMERNLINKKGV